ncbi:6-phospho-beta-glucosidase [Eubacteriales bacterium OttesenSCG-928-A19]|nr:6-phospho-beta-glucosidase [Eubacteriales bacterium OttesenSCG-928-A19]
MLKLAVIGAGSTYTPELVDGLLTRRDIFPVEELVLMDIDERKLRIVGGLAQRMAAHAGGAMRVRLTMALDNALAGADFVMAQLRVGKLPARHLDESIPLKYGLIGQETTGIGGFFKGLRTIPVMLDIAAHMEALCPDAWLISFTNPSGMVAEALLRHTGVRMMGLCNVPIAMLRSAREAVGDEAAEVETVGLNHLSWITSVRTQGREALPELLEKGYAGTRPANLPKSEFDPECLRAACGIPNGYLLYYYDRVKRLAKLQAAEKTRAQECMEIEEELLSMYSDEGLYVKPALLDKRGGHLYSEAAVSLAEAIYNDSGATHTVNVQNGGVLPCLDADEVAEIACRIGKDGARPIPVRATGSLHMADLIRTVKAYERMAVQAAITGDREVALAALMTHPLVGDFDQGRACFDALLAAHREYLPQFFVKG